MSFRFMMGTRMSHEGARCAIGRFRCGKGPTPIKNGPSEILDEPNVDPVKADAFAKLGDVIVVEKSRGGVGRRYRQRSG
ncbi:hypothetical protein [Collinsella vaginalis]|uniref:hypothetical protein n=1 Tax=Collinsella vaginalis TaxID=1870987 RepID=UPI0015C51C3B|nr:hypothetical protein [Collinsella vaginalis]